MQKVYLLIPSFVIGCGAQLYAFLFYKVDRPYDGIENAVFGILHLPLFVIPLACLICISLVSGIGKPYCVACVVALVVNMNCSMYVLSYTNDVL